ncbi:hypothetical protein GTO89_01800 [Heliobacterium gestii]|uniref:VTT domain-containing protein n=1 Tax=Heliomicrobium gestii TaxID=2699 RepID=A0A845L950_HELGE|nr:DedA family protein [Heliomicrobium gestii]MBM7865512.1 membrane protein DedA with SNARE-associated domain [Heliomicrobium gestii]MZP41764.1 hypothetical protein [Heliomicrobium gestii]
MDALKETAHWVVTTYGDLGLFIGLFLEFLGLPFPGELSQAFAGFLISQDHLNLYMTLPVCVAGSLLGSMTAHVIGSRFGHRLLYDWGPRVGLKRQYIDKVEVWFRKNRRTMILFSRWVLGVRHVTPYFTGLVGMPFWETFFWNLIGSILWCVPLILIGVLVGEAYEVFMHAFHHYLSLLVWSLALLATAFYLFTWMGKRRKQTESKTNAEKDPEI